MNTIENTLSIRAAVEIIHRAYHEAKETLF